jgi:3-hydroxybutyryl-CoA dehydrogenase
MKRIAVVGAGTMGNGIAHVFAQNGFIVILLDIAQQQLDKALQTISKNLDRQVAKGTITEEQKQTTLSHISISTDIASGVENVDLVIEAATENLDLKLKLFNQLDASAPQHAILATNTSSLSITKIAAATKRPEQVIGMHFMNPVPIMKLVEIINGYGTRQETTHAIIEIVKRIGKLPCVVKDFPGFVLNRILLPMINEAIYILHEKIAGVEEIDMIMKNAAAHPMGPLQLADLIGLDVCLSILTILYEGFRNPKYAPCPLLVNMVTAGNLGVKSGEGFYVYTSDSKELIVSKQFRSNS